MAAERQSDGDGSDIFWPGYVDAVTNLVLNLLFLLTIMTVAVFMFALELGRASKGGPSKPATEAVKQAPAPASPAATATARETLALKQEIARLTAELELAQRLSTQRPASAKTVDASADVPLPKNGISETLASDFALIVRFTDDAVDFSPEERARLLETLQPVVANGKASLHVDVPAGFSEAKRLGFYRAMAVRNLLIELKVPKENIVVSVSEGQRNANASLVKVK